MILLTLFHPTSALNLKPSSSTLQSWVDLTRPHNIPASMVFSVSGALTTNPLDFNPFSAFETAAIVASVTTASVVVNNYYDAQIENDGDENPITTGSISLTQAKNLFLQLYLFAFISSCAVFNAYEPISIVLFSIFTTCIYSKYLKPHVFIKNIAVASVTSLAPYLGFITSTDKPIFTYQSSIVGLCAATFFGIFSREILMDITDIEDDTKTGSVLTIPVTYGIDKAVVISGFSAFMVCCICYTYSNNVVLGEIGAVTMLYRIFEIAQDHTRCNYAIKESILTFLFVVASFLNF